MRPGTARRLAGYGVAVVAAAGVLCAAGIAGPSLVRTLTGDSAPRGFRPALSGPDRLLTNEYAYWHRHDPRARVSADWAVTSGSFFVRKGVGWTGVPDRTAPDAGSTTGTGSSVFRMVTRRQDFQDMAVSLRIRNLGLVDDPTVAAAPFDGVHVFLRWQSPAELYVVSLNRRDNQIVVKQKLPGGPAGGGRYVTLGHAGFPVDYGVWQPFRIRITTRGAGPGHLVEIEVTDGQRALLTVTDRTAPPGLLDAGAVGLRGDNCNFEVDGFRVTALRQRQQAG